MAMVGEERVWVEAEKDPSGGIVLTLKDVRERRRLAKSRGQHAVKTSVERVTNFPTHLVDQLEKGYPIQFKMFQSAFESMLGGAALGGHQGEALGSHDLGSHYAPYRWIITKDYISSGDEKSAKGTEGPSGADPSLKTNRAHFVMKDDDGETFFEGDIYGEYDGFEPLDDFGMPWAAATSIWYKGEVL